jgi:hypothetical protein
MNANTTGLFVGPVQPYSATGVSSITLLGYGADNQVVTTDGPSAITIAPSGTGQMGTVLDSSFLFNVGNLNIQQTSNIQTNLTFIGSATINTDLYLPSTPQFAMYVVYAMTTGFASNQQWWGVSYLPFWRAGYGTGGPSQAGNSITIAVTTEGRITIYCGSSGSYPNSIVWFNRIF